MKITLEQYGEKITIETENKGLTIWEIGEYLKRLLISAGYHPNNVKELFGDEE